jgi:hypothetical protein
VVGSTDGRNTLGDRGAQADYPNAAIGGIGHALDSGGHANARLRRPLFDRLLGFDQEAFDLEAERRAGVHPIL